MGAQAPADSPVGAPLVGALALAPNLDCKQNPVWAPLVSALALAPNLDCKQNPVWAPLVGALVLAPNLDCNQNPVGAPLVGALRPLQSPQTISAALAMHSTCHTVSIPNMDRTPKFQGKCTKISDIIALFRQDNSHRCARIVIVIQ